MPKSNKYYTSGKKIPLFKRGLFVIGFVLISIACVLVLFEITLRVRGDFLTYSEQNWGLYRSVHEPLNHDHYNAREPYWAYHQQVKDFSIQYHFNSMGFRDVEHHLEKPIGTFRIVVLGDSWVESPGVPFDSIWLRQAEKLLNSSTDGSFHAYEIISAGNSGSDVFNNYLVLKDKMLAYKPDLVVLLFNSSDLSEVLIRGGWERFQEDGTLKFRKPQCNEYYYKHIHTFRFVLHELLGYGWELLKPSEYKSKLAESTQLIASTITGIDKMSNQHSAKFVTAIHPALEEYRTGKYRSHFVKIDSIIRDHSVETHDLWPCMVNSTKAAGVAMEDIYFPTDLHHNSLGHRFMAQCFVQSLKENHLKRTP